jgi:hypothetical protein
LHETTSSVNPCFLGGTSAPHKTRTARGFTTSDSCLTLKNHHRHKGLEMSVSEARVHVSRLVWWLRLALASVSALGASSRPVGALTSPVRHRRPKVRPGRNARRSHRSAGPRRGQIRSAERAAGVRALQHGASGRGRAVRTRTIAGVALVADYLTTMLPPLVFLSWLTYTAWSEWWI